MPTLLLQGLPDLSAMVLRCRGRMARPLRQVRHGGQGGGVTAAPLNPPALAPASREPILILGVPVDPARLEWLEGLALACAAKGITIPQWYALASAKVAE